uniref:Uncharacterized protein n=1 Tax=Ciona savignyi TaxID=51511 RepID=H2Z1D2_CIOSA
MINEDTNANSQYIKHHQGILHQRQVYFGDETAIKCAQPQILAYPHHPSYTVIHPTFSPAVYFQGYPAHIQPALQICPQGVYASPYGGNLVNMGYAHKNQQLQCKQNTMKKFKDDNKNYPTDNSQVQFVSTPKRSPRYDSADSGIGEPTISMTSSWINDDTNSDSSSAYRRNSLSGSDSGIEKDGNESYWTVDDDDTYWARFGQNAPPYYVTNPIAKQIEYYLSDEYLIKDKYLLRQIRCKKDGYVSIKLITSFKKVKKLTRDWAVVRSAIVRLSSSIVVSSEGLRIRRRTNLSEVLRKPRILTSVLAIRLPEEFNSVESVTSLFALFGEIGFVRLLRPDKEIPSDLRNYATQVEDIGKTLCAVVDFDQSEDALSSVRILKYLLKPNKGDCDDARDNETIIESEIARHEDSLKNIPSLGGTRVALLGPRVRRTLYRQDRVSSSLNDEEAEPTSTLPLSVNADEESVNNDPRHVRHERGNDVATTSKLSPRFRIADRRQTCALLRHNSATVTRQPRGPDAGSRGFNFSRRNVIG